MKKMLLLALLPLVACASAGAPAAENPAEPGVAPAPPATGPDSADLVPAGHGTLRQDDFTVALRSDALLVKVTPLAESVILLAAPDTYSRLHALAENRRPEAERAAGEQAPQLFLVSFFSYQPDVPFTPEDLVIMQQGRRFRPLAILPMTTGWGYQRLQQQESQSAVYAFDPRLDLRVPLTVEYQGQQSGLWDEIIRRLEIERAKARSRAGGPE